MFTRATASVRRTCWLALVAMLALALLPTVSHALAASRGAVSWAEVCTPQGTRFVALDDAQDEQDEQPAPMSQAGHLEHCPFCAPSAGALGMPPAALPALVLPQLATEVPPLFLHAPRTPFAWRSAQPRAPPPRS